MRDRAVRESIRMLAEAIPIRLGPATQGDEFLRLKCRCEFEGHGRASETWEEHWYLELPSFRPHWKSTSGWRECNEQAKGVQTFHGRSPEQVIDEALVFLSEIRNA